MLHQPSRFSYCTHSEQASNAYCCQMLSIGCAFNLAVFYDSVQGAFGASHLETGALFAFTSFTACATGFLVERLLRLGSERDLVMLGGLLSALGFGIAATTDSFAVALVGIALLNGPVSA